MNKYYITFGQIHTHSLAGRTLDKDTVLELEAESQERARKIAFDLLGPKWSMMHENDKPDMKHYPKGIVKHNG